MGIRWVDNIRQGWHQYLPLFGLILVFLFVVAIFTYPSLTDELAAIGTVSLTFGLVYLYYQQKSILATEHEPEIILEGVKEIVDDEWDNRRLLALSLSNIGKGQATDLQARVKSELNNPRIPMEDKVKNLNRYDGELDGWLQKPGSADYLDAGDRNQIFVVDLSNELIFGTHLGGLIGTTDLDKNSWEPLDADRLYLKMEIEYQDTLGRKYSDLAFDYVGPFEEQITLTEFFGRGFQRDIYDDLKDSFEEDDCTDGPDMSDFDPIDRADGKAMEALSEKPADEGEED